MVIVNINIIKADDEFPEDLTEPVEIDINAFIDLNRSQIINAIDLTVDDFEINQNNLTVIFSMYSIEKINQNYFLIRKNINTILPFYIINYCWEVCGLGACNCMELLITATQSYEATIPNYGMVTVEPINYQLITLVNMEIDKIVDMQDAINNENIINNIIDNGIYELPIIE